METELRVLERNEEPRKIEIHWSESEWFQVWLRLARRDYHGRPDGQHGRQLNAMDALDAA